MGHNSYIVWWLLAVPIVLAVVDRLMMSGSRTAASQVQAHSRPVDPQRGGTASSVRSAA